MRRTLALLFALPVLFGQCQNPISHSDASPEHNSGTTVDQAFKDYWYSGKAELSRYKLQQSRYGEIREGNAVMVFVTEPFLTESQVKKEKETDEPSTTVLKLNKTKDFVTGIYDYHMMTSVFDPIDRENFDGPLKMTTSSQEWCGQSFMQLNQRGDGYEVEGRSYFQEEGDVDKKIEDVLLEDGIWTRIRMGPDKLPKGEHRVLPSGMDIRLMHLGMEAQKAELSKFEPRKKDSIYPGKKLAGYKVHYQDPERILRIFYETEFPHRIAGWEILKGEEEKLWVRAVRTHQIRSPYWKKNARKHRKLRQKLGLEK
jgi:hypothetical protein